MIASVLAQQLQRGVEDFLRTTFPVSTPHFEGVLDRLLDEDGSVFKGPFLSLQLPFKLGGKGDSEFSYGSLGFRPYLHQQRAFERLTADPPRSTLVATGTGSGKTEAFLLPILEYCYRNRKQPGIKAIIVYPMNALANDQAGRIARLIAENESLSGAVTAGLYIGQRDRVPRKAMTADSVITDRTSLRLDPPDILLTNYKMLDYLLIRPDDLPLWAQNDSERLQYLVVDELHTFDGAQGTDLACLIRRLKARLGTPENYLCCVGTSATLGGEDARKELIEYGRSIFGEPFNVDSIIMESRQSIPEFLGDTLVHSFGAVSPNKGKALSPYEYNSIEAYLRAQVDLWFGGELVIDDFASPRWRVELGDLLKAHSLFRNLLTVLNGEVRSLQEFQRALGRATPELQAGDRQYQRDLLDSLIALVAAARVRAPESARGSGGDNEQAQIRSFLDVRVQLWLRELRRMVASVAAPPRLAFFDDLTDEQRHDHLPVIQCRDCGSTGWGAMQRPQDEWLRPDLQPFYQGFFGRSPNVKFLFPDDSAEVENLPGISAYVDGELRLHGSEPDTPSLRVFVPDNVTQGKNNQHFSHRDCPYCGSRGSLTILGSRAASLTSVLITQLYASGYNDHKKLITFADSVQDASHRAGFFSARTYRFNIRTALQKFVGETDEALGELTLEDIPDRFSRFWSDRFDEKEFITTFIAPDMTWLESYEHLTEHGRLPAASDLADLVRKRVSWEIFSEYGYRARIGRTLEKSGASIALPDPGRVDDAVKRLLHVLPNEIGGFGDLEAAVVRPFLLGLLSHLRTQGAIYHQALDGFISSGGNTFQLTRIPFMPGYGHRTRVPVFLTAGAHRRFDSLYSASGSKGSRTWYEAWAVKCLEPSNLLVRSVLHDVYDHVLNALLAQNLLEERQVKGDPVWGIPPTAIRLTRHVVQLRCDRCSHATAAAEVEVEARSGAPCLRFRCTGNYRETDAALDYYGKLYATGDVQRIIAAEHTGLLDRDKRELLEEQFEKGGHPWDPNLLSATPTLEMGIDIGDLATVILGSIPPSEANYIQRIGRSGRRDGSALNLAVANGRPHDLYFYAQPKEMIEGEIHPPGVFLQAAAVLERQFTGFCLDRWVETGLSRRAIPANLRSVLDELDQEGTTEFPHNLLTFVAGRREDLVENFISLFGDSLGEDAVGHLQWFAGLQGLVEGTLDYKLIRGLEELRTEREGLRKNIRRLRRRIRAMGEQEVKDKNYETELNELRGERNALQRIVREQIDRRHTLNFLTDEGLIPNYAFPEAGVTLRSVIYRKRGDDPEAGWENLVYEYERPAVSAISELAPASRFYAEGRNVRVDQIDLTVADIEEWRFCDSCSFSMRQVEGDVPSTCPRCESAQWADAGQQQPMVRMRQVFARESDRRSRTTDDSDDRQPLFFNKQLLVDYEQHHITSAFLIDDEELPFGFEFLSRVNLREVNFGERSFYGQPLRVAGVEMPRRGFTICRYCGKVQPSSGDAEHAYSCPVRNSGDDADFQKCLYLYREFSSEGIRVLLPETTFVGSDKTLHSFIAALQLGLRKTFQGKIDHLQVADFEEPIPGFVHRKRSLVLYDTVPGGTGYLKELMRNPEPLLSVFENALDTLRSCSCNDDPEKDGCYRCLYAYRNSYDMAATSRDRAIGLLSAVLKRRDHLKKVDTLRGIPVNALFDSELEARFIDELRQVGRSDYTVSVSAQIVHNKPGYFLQVADESYYVEPQAELGTQQGVGVPSRADFVIYPARTGTKVKPIAIFVDGWAYHHDRIGQDLAQRMAIARSGQLHVFSLTWNDLEKAGDPESDHATNLLAPALPVPGGLTYHQLVKGFDGDHDTASLLDVQRQDSFTWLVRFLAHPNPSAWTAYAAIQALLLTDREISRSADRQSQWKDMLDESCPPHVVDFVRDIGPEVFGQYELGAGRMRWFMAATEEGVRTLDPEAIRYVAVLEDEDAVPEDQNLRRLWNGMLRLFNIIQFLPGIVLNRRGVQSHAFDDIDFAGAPLGPPMAIELSGEEWGDLRELTLPESLPILDAVRSEGWPMPEVGYELVSSGRVAGLAEFAWPTYKLAVIDSADTASTSAFHDAGWRVESLNDALNDPVGFATSHKSPDTE